MTLAQLISALNDCHCIVEVVPNGNGLLHVDGYHHPEAKGLPDWLWNTRGWVVSSSCGFGRVFVMPAR